MTGRFSSSSVSVEFRDGRLMGFWNPLAHPHPKASNCSRGRRLSVLEREGRTLRAFYSLPTELHLIKDEHFVVPRTDTCYNYCLSHRRTSFIGCEQARCKLARLPLYQL